MHTLLYIIEASFGIQSASVFWKTNIQVNAFALLLEEIHFVEEEYYICLFKPLAVDNT